MKIKWKLHDNVMRKGKKKDARGINKCADWFLALSKNGTTMYCHGIFYIAEKLFMF